MGSELQSRQQFEKCLGLIGGITLTNFRQRVGGTGINRNRSSLGTEVKQVKQSKANTLFHLYVESKKQTKLNKIHS